MALDRTGEEIPDHNCRNGWLTPPDSDSPRLCWCRMKDRQPPAGEPVASARAQAAIDRDNERD